MNIVINQHKVVSNHNTIKVRNRIGNKIISTDNIKFKEVNMNGAIRSIKLENKYFTNFVKSYDKKLYIQLKKIFDDIILKKATLDEKFILLNNDNQNEEKEKRLQEIIKENLNIEKIPSLMKLKPKTPKNDQTLDGVRLYVYYNKITEEFELYLIDLYHLGIDGKNYKIGKYDLKGRYKVNAEYKKCISKIADDYT